jgi:hypothetical protein
VRIYAPFPTKAMNLLGANDAPLTDPQFPTLYSRFSPQPCPEHRDRSPNALPSFSHRGLCGSYHEGRAPSGCESRSEGFIGMSHLPWRFTVLDRLLAVFAATLPGTSGPRSQRPTQLLPQGFTRFIPRRSRTFWVRTGSISDGIGADGMDPYGPIQPKDQYTDE